MLFGAANIFSCKFAHCREISVNVSGFPLSHCKSIEPDDFRFIFMIADSHALGAAQSMLNLSTFAVIVDDWHDDGAVH